MLALVIILSIALLVTIFALRNSQLVSVDLFFIQGQMNLALLILICILIGALIMAILSMVRRTRIAKTNKNIKKDHELIEKSNSELEKDLANYRARVGVLESKNRTLEKELSAYRATRREEIVKEEGNVEVKDEL